MGNILARFAWLMGARRIALPQHEVTVARMPVAGNDDELNTESSSEEDSEADEMPEPDKTEQEDAADGLDGAAGHNMEDPSIDREDEDDDEDADKGSDSAPDSDSDMLDETDSDTDDTMDSDDEEYVEEPPLRTVGRRTRRCSAGGCCGSGGSGRVLRSTTAYYRQLYGGK